MDVAGSGRIILRLDLLVGNFFEQSQDLIDRNPGAGTAVEDHSGSAVSLAGPQGLVHHIFDVGEIARLFAITIYNGLLPL